MTSLPVMETKYPENHTSPTMSSPPCTNAMCIFYTVAHVIFFVLGISGNGLVIWIAGFKIKRSVITTWYLSLAVSDFIYCSTFPFGVVHKVNDAWIFGPFACKLRYFIKILNMYSSIFLLVIISVDRCVVIMFPLWALTKRTVRKASAIVAMAWIIAAALSSPTAVFRDVRDNHCVRNDANKQSHVARVLCRFVFGFVIPFLIIVACYIVIMRKLKIDQLAKSKRPFKIMTGLIVAFLICWLPFHTFSFLQIHYKDLHFVKNGKVFGTALASANSFLNPLLYAFMGKDFKREFCAVLSNIENAMEEDEGQDKARGAARKTPEENKCLNV